LSTSLELGKVGEELDRSEGTPPMSTGRQADTCWRRTLKGRSGGRNHSSIRHGDQFDGLPACHARPAEASHHGAALVMHDIERTQVSGIREAHLAVHDCN
jgi:hypothetical protein